MSEDIAGQATLRQTDTKTGKTYHFLKIKIKCFPMKTWEARKEWRKPEKWYTWKKVKVLVSESLQPYEP